ncbi:MAG: DUF2853 family protein [Saprospiraceae bacterium]
MSQFEDKVHDVMDAAKGLNITVNPNLLTKVAKGLGPSIYNADASLVSSSDPDEINRVKTNFLKGKLGCTNEKEMDDAIAHAVTTLGVSNRNKFRILFYYLCVEKSGKGYVYND